MYSRLQGNAQLEMLAWTFRANCRLVPLRLYPCNRAFSYPSGRLSSSILNPHPLSVHTKARAACAWAERPQDGTFTRLLGNVISPLFLLGFTSAVLLLIDLKNRSSIEGILIHLSKSQNVVTMTRSFFALFLISMAISVVLGYMCIPLLRQLKAYQIFRREGPSSHFSKVGTPTMGGLCFVPVGALVAAINTRFTSVFLNNLAIATLAFGVIGFVDDVLALVRKHNYGLPGWCKFCLQIVTGTCVCLWLKIASLQTESPLKTLVHFPLPVGSLDLDHFYLPLAVFCFTSMSNGVNLTDGLDGLASGTTAAAFIGMTLAVMHVYPAVGMFGASMAGACVGFLFHNRHNAEVFMGDTGSLSLGGGLAAMATCTGMFLPLFVISGIFFLETVSVIIQVSYKLYTKKTRGVAQRIFRMAPIHHHFELSDINEPTIVAVAYVISCCLALVGGFIGFNLLDVRLVAW